MLFGRAHEEIAYLHECRIRVEVVAGVTAALAAAADTVAIYMGAGEASAIRAALIIAGKPAATPVVVVENASLPGMRKVFGTLGDLEALAAGTSGGPALILLGEIYREVVAAGQLRKSWAVRA